jgi:peptide/nickel transport system substrate-binding protein
MRFPKLRSILILLLLALAVPVGSAQKLVVAQLANPLTLDPNRTFNGNSFSVTNQVYETLVTFNQDGELVGRLATSWEFVEPTMLELTRREGVTFHDGTPLTAEAVKASFEHFLDPELTTPGRYVLSMISEIQIPEPGKIRLITDEPFAPLVAHLAHPVSAIVQAELGASLEQNPVGTGPFKFVSWNQGNSVLLTANADYWGGAPAIQEVEFRIIPEVATVLIELRSGGVDAFYGIPADSFASLSADPALETEAFLGWGSSYVGFNLQNPKLQDIRVRRAIAHAVDKELITEEFLQGLALPAVAAIPPTVRFAATDLIEPYPYDLDIARELLAEAGATNLNLRIDLYPDPNLEAVAQVLQFQLAEIGVNLELRVQEYAAYVEALERDDAELYASSWGTVTLDADYALWAFLHPSEIGGGGSNNSRYDNPVVTEWLEIGRTDPDDAVRAEVYHEVQEQILVDVPFVTLYYPLSTFAKTAALQGEHVNFSIITFDLRDATLQP